MSELSIRLRPANEEDIAFIFNSWLKSYRSSFFARTMPNSIYFAEHHKVVEKILKRSQIIMAVNEEDATQLYGYIVAEKIDDIVCTHYVYIKQPFRNLGIAKTLFHAIKPDGSETASVSTHFTRVCTQVCPRYRIIHHPYLYINDSDEPEAEKLPSDKPLND